MSFESGEFIRDLIYNLPDGLKERLSNPSKCIPDHYMNEFKSNILKIVKQYKEEMENMKLPFYQPYDGVSETLNDGFDNLLYLGILCQTRGSKNCYWFDKDKVQNVRKNSSWSEDGISLIKKMSNSFAELLE
ncbi:MAG: hypothetical protein GON13_02060 [Nanoarchaeota archaeon]|nr:hypothetical protein [Nanoarchaeota archaeon]